MFGVEKGAFAKREYKISLKYYFRILRIVRTFSSLIYIQNAIPQLMSSKQLISDFANPTQKTAIKAEKALKILVNFVCETFSHL